MSPAKASLRLVAFFVVGSGILLGSTVTGIRGAGESRTAEPKQTIVSSSLYIVRKRATLPDAPPPESKEEYESFLRVQQELLKSRLVLGAALRIKAVADLPILKPHADPSAWLQKNLRVEYPSPEILVVGIEGDDAEQLATVVDAIVEAYLQNVVNQERTNAASRLLALKSLQENTIATLKRQRATLRTMSDPGPLVVHNHRLAREQYASVLKDLVETQSSLRRLQAEEEVLKDGRLAVIREQLEIQKRLEKVLKVLAEDLAQKIQAPDRSEEELAPLRSEIKAKEELIVKIGRGIEAVSLDLEMPPRVIQLEKAQRRPKK